MTRATEATRLQPLRIVRDGLFAGLAGAAVVAVAHAVTDAAAGELLRTPTALGALVLDGPEAALATHPDPGIALRFTGIHAATWIGIGIVGSLLVSLVDVQPKLAPLVFGCFAFVFISLSYLSGAYSLAGLGSMHLWIGTLLGSAAAAGYLAFRHPRLAGRIEGVSLTGTTRSELERALELEARGCEALDTAANDFRDSPLAEVLAAKRGHVAILSQLVDELGLREPGEVDAAWTAATAQEAVRNAIAHERELVDLYDRFLAGVPEARIREVFLRLRYHALDTTIARLEEALGEKA